MEQKNNSGLKAALIAVGVALVAVVTVLVLFLTGVFGKQDEADRTATGNGSVGRTRQSERETDDEEQGPELYDVEIEGVARVFALENNGGSIDVMEASYETLTIPDASRGAREAIDEINAERAQSVRDQVLDNAQSIRDMYYEGLGYWPWELSYEFHMERADSDLISFAETESAYYGGSNRSNYYLGHTLDAESGREYALLDIVKNYADLAEAIGEEMARSTDPRFREVLEYCRQTSGSFAEYFTDTFLNDTYAEYVPWTVTADGVHIWFNNYLFGIFGFEPLDILVPYEKHPDLFRDAALFENAGTQEAAFGRVTRRNTDPQWVLYNTYCWEEEGFFPKDYSDVAGTYTSNTGYEIEITQYGNFIDYTAVANGEEEPVYGLLRADHNGYNMYYYPDNTGSSDMPGREHYGRMSVLNADTVELDTMYGCQNYYRQGAGMGGGAPEIMIYAMEHGLGSGDPTLLREGEQNGYWEDPVLGNSVRIYESRGEFEAVNHMTGDSWTGYIIDNDNDEEPRYALLADTGYHLATLHYFYFDYNGTQVPIMSITLHYATGDYTTNYIKW